MKLTSRETRRCTHPADAYSDAELDALGWKALSALCSLSDRTLYHRVEVLGMSRRDAVKTPPQRGSVLTRPPQHRGSS